MENPTRPTGISDGRLPLLVVAAALAIAVAVLAVRGSDVGQDSAAKAPSEAALAEPDEGASDGVRQPVPLALEGGLLGPGGVERAGVDMEGEPLGGIWEPSLYAFSLDPGASVPPAEAEVWRMVPPAQLREAVDALADRLGMPPPPPPGEGDAFYVDLPDGRSLWVSKDGDWYFSGRSDLFPEWDCPDPSTLGESEQYECAPPPPSDGLPSDRQAEQAAAELFALLPGGPVLFGIPSRDDWSVSLAGQMVLPGGAYAEGLQVSVGFGPDGALAWASGTLAVPELLAVYPLAPAQDVLARMEGEVNAWVEDVAAAGPPVGQEGTLAVEQVVLVRVEMVLWPTFTRSMEYLLVPHLVFFAEDGSSWAAVAIAPDLLS